MQGRLPVGFAREGDEDFFRLLGSRASAARLGVDRMERPEALQKLEDDLLDISLVAARLATTGSNRTVLDDVLAQFGLTRAQLRQLATDADAGRAD